MFTWVAFSYKGSDIVKVTPEADDDMVTQLLEHIHYQSEQLLSRFGEITSFLNSNEFIEVNIKGKKDALLRMKESLTKNMAGSIVVKSVSQKTMNIGEIKLF